MRFRKPDRTQTTKRGFATKRQAELYLANAEVEKATGTYLDPANGKLTVGELGRTWLRAQAHLKPSSIAVIESTWRLHVEPYWGKISIADVRHSNIQSWVQLLSDGQSGRRKPKSPTLVHRAHGVLSGILEVAVRDRRISSNPAKAIRLPRRVGRSHRYLTHAQVHALAQASGQHGTLIRVLAYTGLRWGEVTALRVDDVDFSRARISIERNAVLVKGATIVGTPKTYQQRTVPFPEFLRPALDAAVHGKQGTELVFGDVTGGYMKTPTIRHNSWFDRAIATADLPVMTIHDLRHTAASLAISAGAHVKALQRMLGHASAAMTLDTYADLFEDDLDNVSERLNQAALATDVVKMWSNVRDDPSATGREQPELLANKGK